MELSFVTQSDLLEPKIDFLNIEINASVIKKLIYWEKSYLKTQDCKNAR